MQMTDGEFLDLARRQGVTLEKLPKMRAKARAALERGDDLASLTLVTLNRVEIALRRDAGEDVTALRERMHQERELEVHGCELVDDDGQDGPDAEPAFRP